MIASQAFRLLWVSGPTTPIFSLVMATRSSSWQYKTGTHRPLRVLVDMDCVMCDLESQALKRYREKYPEEPYIPLEKRNTFYLRDQYSKLRDDLGVCGSHIIAQISIKSPRL